MLPSPGASSKHHLQVRAPTPPLIPHCPSTHPPHVPTWDARAICSHADGSANNSGARSHPDHPSANPLSDHQSANPLSGHPSAKPHPNSSALVQPGWYCAVNVAWLPMCAHSRSHATKSVPRECFALRHDVCIARVWVRCDDCCRPAAASCAAGYAWGVDGSNRCPASYFAIITAAACAIAATAAGKAYIGSEKDPSYPSGCYFHQGAAATFTKAGVYFSDDAVGAGALRTKLLCSGAARLARPAEAPRATMGVLTGYCRYSLG
jgi:hypothetical protein